MAQQQFLQVLSRDEAESRFRAAVGLAPLGDEIVSLHAAHGRILAVDVVSRADVPSFDRSNYDGYAVRAADTAGAEEESPCALQLLPDILAAGVTPICEVVLGAAVSIATGGMLPRGADSVVMVEHTDVCDGCLQVQRPVTPGFGVSFTGSDIAAGETVLRKGQLITSRETGVLAAVGQASASVWRKPTVGIYSTGNEVIAPGEESRPGSVFDSNAYILADAVRESGGEPQMLGIVRDDAPTLRARLLEAIEHFDLILLSGGTSKGADDQSYRVVRELAQVVAHGVALKPGKPVCLAAHKGKPVVILPGFPTSAIFTFHEFVAPVIRLLGGRSAIESAGTREAQLATRVNSEVGRTEFLLVSLVEQPVDGEESPALAAFPLGKGSGSVTTFSHADGFVKVDRHEEIVEAGTKVRVQLLGRDAPLADLVVIGSHCIGLDYLLGQLHEKGIRTKFLAVGSTAGLDAAQRGRCDLAGIHLLDPTSGEYNQPFLTPEVELIRGYPRMQGLVHRRADPRFEGRSVEEMLAVALEDANCLMVNRNQGSGTRILIDKMLNGAQPAGYAMQSRSHNAVAAAVHQGRADWGVAIRAVAERLGLGFAPLTEECYDFVSPRTRSQRPAVRQFRELLEDAEVRIGLQELHLW